MGANTSRAREAEPAARADVQHVLDGIRRIVQTLRQSSHEAERRTGLTAAQLFVLQRLGDADCSSLNELAERTFTHQSTVSTVVSKLVAAGLIERTPAANDRRRLELALTARGRRVLAAAPDAAQDRLIAAIGALPAATRHALGRTLAELAGSLAPADQRTRMFFEDAAGEGGAGVPASPAAAASSSRNHHDAHDRRRPTTRLTKSARAARRTERTRA